MPGIDLLISRDLSLEIKNNLDQNILKKLEKDLFFEHGMSIKLSIEHFEKFDRILKNIYKNDSKKFEKDCIKKIIHVQKYGKFFKIKIINKKLSNKLLDYFGDQETRKILMCIMGEKLTISNILKQSKILKSSLYRKIENLILDGVILETGKMFKNSKRISQYICLFDEIQVNFKQNNLQFECLVNPINFNKSSIAKIQLFDN